jgi:hypothetical protein
LIDMREGRGLVVSKFKGWVFSFFSPSSKELFLGGCKGRGGYFLFLPLFIYLYMF